MVYRDFYVGRRGQVVGSIFQVRIPNDALTVHNSALISSTASSLCQSEARSLNSRPRWQPLPKGSCGVGSGNREWEMACCDTCVGVPRAGLWGHYSRCVFPTMLLQYTTLCLSAQQLLDCVGSRNEATTRGPTGNRSRSRKSCTSHFAWVPIPLGDDTAHQIVADDMRNSGHA